MIGGAEPRTITIADYDPSWPSRFEEERSAVITALGDRARRVEHIGSTAVPGMAAKPVIDIQLTVDDLDDVAAYDPMLTGAGYELRVLEPGHRMYRTADRDVHVHLWSDPADERRHLLFRDYLRNSRDDRIRYEDLKRALSHQEWPDMNYYAQAKGPLVAEIMRNAEAWADEVSWSAGDQRD